MNNDFVSFCPSISPICGKNNKVIAFFIFEEQNRRFLRKFLLSPKFSLNSSQCQLILQNRIYSNQTCPEIALFYLKTNDKNHFYADLCYTLMKLGSSLSLITRYLWCICVNRITLLNRKHHAVETAQNIYKPIMLKLINKQCTQHQYLSL